MRVEDLLAILENPQSVADLAATLSLPQYEGKTVIMSSDDLLGTETDAQLENIVAVRELVYG